MNHRQRLLAVLIAVLLVAAAPAFAAAGDETARPEVVGGTEAPDGAYPFMAALVWSDVLNARQGLRCGGTMLTDEWVLTAAHCTDGLEAADFDVVVGRQRLTSTDGERIAVAEIHEHPGWDDVTYEHDIALLLLEAPATAGEPIDWVTEELANWFAGGTVATVAGWGTTEDDPPGTGNGVQNDLREADVPVRSEAECTNAVPPGEFFPGSMICAGYPEGGIDSCAGDSGGPLFLRDGERWRQVGIVSWGYGCADPGDFGYYTRLAAYDEWIREVTGLIACEGSVATIVGTSGDDDLLGAGGIDVIVGGEGDDFINGRGGDDILCGGPGEDRITGGSGDDLVSGGAATDRLFGRVGDDEIHGGDGRDFIKGGPDGDLVFGGPTRDVARGQDGDDVLYGGANDDALFGGDGGDQLYGEDDDDVVYGYGGGDTISGGDGDDDARGGSGDDDVDGGDGVDFVSGGPGTDVCRSGETGLWGCETLL